MSGLPGGAFQGSAFGLAQGDVFIPEIWRDEIKRERDTTFAMKPTVRVFEMQGKPGDLIHIPEISRLAINDKLPSTPVTLQSRTETEFTIIIDRYKEVSFMLEDIIRIQSQYNLRKEYTREAGYALSRDMDNHLLSLRGTIQGNANQVIYNTSDGTASGTYLAINRASILAAMQLLNEADVPQSNRCMLVSPGQYVDLLTIPEFISADFVGNKPTVSGQIGTLYGTIPVIQSSNVTVNSLTGYVNGAGGTAQPTPGVVGSPYVPTQGGFTSLPYNGDGTATQDVVTATLCQKDWAIHVVQQSPRVEASREIMFQSDAVVSTNIYGSKVFRPDHCVLIHTAT